jgi:hypothetical protein
MARKFFDHEQFNFEFQCALGGVHYGAGDVGELLSTADRVVDGDADSWCQEWIATAQRLATVAEGCASSGHQVSARAAYLRAATHYAMALCSGRRHEGPCGSKRNFPAPSGWSPSLLTRAQTGTASQWPDPFWSNACSIG